MLPIKRNINSTRRHLSDNFCSPLFRLPPLRVINSYHNSARFNKGSSEKSLNSSIPFNIYPIIYRIISLKLGYSIETICSPSQPYSDSNRRWHQPRLCHPFVASCTPEMTIFKILILLSIDLSLIVGRWNRETPVSSLVALK